MSLQVWLPLTKDLRNQGLSDVTVTNNGATFNSAGKLGGCYSFGTGASGMTLPASVMNNFTEGSVAFWIKLNSWNTNYATFFQAGTGSTPWNNYIFGVLRNNSNSTVCFTIGNGSSASNNSYLTSAWETGIWFHMAFTYEAGKCKIYKNGKLDKEYTTTIVPNFTKISKISIGRSNADSSYQTHCDMSDFRIYDHCLSPMEVKELAKGLILHYPLNRQGWGQENLMPNSIEMPIGSADPSTGTWRLAGSSQMTQSRVAISDAPSGALTYGFQSIGLQTGQDASCWGIDGFPRENGATYTLSAWGRIVGGSSTAAMLGFAVYHGTTLDYGGTYGKAVSSEAKYYGSGASDYAGGQLNPNGSWTRIYRTFTSTSTSDNIYIGFNTAKTGSNVTLQLCGVKLEKGDKMTPWVPNSNESMYTTLSLNGIIEYDCSGYCNNLNRNGTYSYTSDTPKYEVSTVFNGTEWMNGSTPRAEILTLACWAKTIKNKSTSQFMVADSTSGLCISFFSGTIVSYFGSSSQSSTGSKCTLGSAYKENDWNHFVVVKTGVGTRKVYCNGVEQTATSNDYWGAAGGLFIGSRNNSATLPFYGELCDVRAYATALSASDVLSLYQNSAYIDSSGNVYGAVHSEV